MEKIVIERGKSAVIFRQLIAGRYDKDEESDEEQSMHVFSFDEVLRMYDVIAANNPKNKVLLERIILLTDGKLEYMLCFIAVDPSVFFIDIGKLIHSDLNKELLNLLELFVNNHFVNTEGIIRICVLTNKIKSDPEIKVILGSKVGFVMPVNGSKYMA